METLTTPLCVSCRRNRPFLCVLVEGIKGKTKGTLTTPLCVSWPFICVSVERVKGKAMATLTTPLCVSCRRNCPFLCGSGEGVKNKAMGTLTTPLCVSSLRRWETTKACCSHWRTLRTTRALRTRHQCGSSVLQTSMSCCTTSTRSRGNGCTWSPSLAGVPCPRSRPASSVWTMTSGQSGFDLLGSTMGLHHLCSVGFLRQTMCSGGLSCVNGWMFMGVLSKTP